MNKRKHGKKHACHSGKWNWTEHNYWNEMNEPEKNMMSQRVCCWRCWCCCQRKQHRHILRPSTYHLIVYIYFVLNYTREEVNLIMARTRTYVIVHVCMCGCVRWHVFDSRSLFVYLVGVCILLQSVLYRECTVKIYYVLRLHDCLL